mmetsp:Transcript_20177/g.40941  ORF Transcript_20177/g.40941 Transcript_20177/m.40941 type:complete len:438 (+) Transcript_20177:49-1362(+)
MTDDSRPNFFHIGGDDSGIHPSGVAWPPALRRKLGLDSLPPESSSSSPLSSSPSLSSETSTVDTLNDPFDPSTASQPPPSNRSFTAEQLRKYIHQSYAALSSLQRQLHRGEESYFEETYNRGNIFAGFDNIWIDAGNNHSSGGSSSSGIAIAAGDAAGATAGGGAGGPSAAGGADVAAVVVGGGGANAGGSSSNKAAPARKMPGDHRWFSTSCGSVVATGDGRVAALERVSLLERPPAVLDERERASAGASASGEGVSNAKGTIQERKVDAAVKKSQSTQPKRDNLLKAVLPQPLAVKSEPVITTSSTAAEATASAAKKQSTTTSKPIAPATEVKISDKKSTPAATSSLPSSSTMAAPIPRKSSSSSTASTGSAPASKDNNLMTGSIPRKRPAIPVVVPSASNTGTSSSSNTANVSAASTSSTEQGKKKSGKKRKHS